MRAQDGGGGDCARGAGPRPWRVAWAEAASRFYASPAGAPAQHFRTTAMLGGVLGDVLADAMAVLVAEVDASLGRPAVLDVVDVGAGDGALLAALAQRVDGSRVRLTAVDLRPRPATLAAAVRWRQGPALDVLPSVWPEGVTGLVMAHEWLDDVPCDVLAVDDDGDVRLVLVDIAGKQRLGPRLVDVDACAALGVDGAGAAAWVARYVDTAGLAGRSFEVGLARDAALRALVSTVHRGTLLAVDYTAAAGAATLRGWRVGTPRPPVPDGSMNLTAHVVVTSCVEAVRADRRVRSVEVGTQREALTALGVVAALPSPGGDPSSYVSALARANAAAVAADPAGLGAYEWIRIDV